MRIGLVGFGSIGGFIAEGLGSELAWVVDADAGAEARMRHAGLHCPFYSKIPEKCGGAKLVVEAASQQAVPLLLECLPFCDIMVMSVGALADSSLRQKLLRSAEKHGRKIHLPSGAIGGLDAISAVGDKMRSVTLETRKPPASLGRNDARRAVVFEGSAAEACRLYPKNVNVAAALSLAGIGFERTRVRIVSDPAEKNNTHRIIAESEAGRMELVFENLPSKKNPKTSALAALSALRRIRKIGEAVQLG